MMTGLAERTKPYSLAPSAMPAIVVCDLPTHRRRAELRRRLAIWLDRPCCWCGKRLRGEVLYHRVCLERKLQVRAA